MRTEREWQRAVQSTVLEPKPSPPDRDNSPFKEKPEPIQAIHAKSPAGRGGRCRRPSGEGKGLGRLSVLSQGGAGPRRCPPGNLSPERDTKPALGSPSSSESTPQTSRIRSCRSSCVLCWKRPGLCVPGMLGPCPGQEGVLALHPGPRPGSRSCWPCPALVRDRPPPVGPGRGHGVPAASAWRVPALGRGCTDTHSHTQGPLL